MASSCGQGGISVRRGWRRWIIVYLLMATAAQQSLVSGPGVVEAAAEVGAATSQPRPVLLIGDCDYPEARTWGLRQGVFSPFYHYGLYRRLELVGYGDRVAVYHYPRDLGGQMDLSAALDNLEERVEALAQDSATGQIDVVTFGLGAIVLRLYLLVAGTDSIHSVIMIAPPNHGSHLSLALKGGYYQQLFNGLATSSYALGALEPAGPGLPAPPSVEFTDESSYLAHRAEAYLGLLLHQEALAAFLATRPSERGNRPRAGSVMASVAPMALERYVIRGQHPVVDWDWMDLSGGHEQDGALHSGHILTRAYYELQGWELAMRAFEVRRAEGRRVALLDLADIVNPTVTGGDWRVTLIQLALKAGLRAAYNFITENWRQLLASGLWKMGDLVTARRVPGLALDLTMPERISRELSSGANPELTCNNLLERLNEESAQDANSRPRFVVVLGKAATTAVTGIVNIPPGDGVVSVSSPLIPLKGDDVCQGFVRGLFTSPLVFHWGLLYNRRVQRFVLDELAWERPDLSHDRARENTLADPGTATPNPNLRGKADAFFSRPTYLAIPHPGVEVGPGKVWALEISFGQVQLGLLPQVWVARGGAEGTRSDGGDEATDGFLSVPVTHRGYNYQAVVPFDGVEALLIGVRLSTKDGGGAHAEPGITWGLMRAATACQYRLVQVQKGRPVQAAPTSPLPTDPSTTDPSMTDPSTDRQPPPVGYSTEVSPDTPIIHVIRRNKQTTLKKERRIYHARWVWDFGDGSVAYDNDPTWVMGTSQHVFSTPGQYRVRARSYANDGRGLRDHSWQVSIGPGDVGQPRSFALESISEPEVTIRLIGPETWVTGRPALFHVEYDVTLPPFVEDAKTKVYPAPAFAVVWERPGRFTVKAAVNLRFSYRFPERSVYVSCYYIREVPMEVLTTVLTD